MRTRITPNTNNFYAVNVTIIGRDQLFDISWNYNIRIISIYIYTYFCIKNVININCRQHQVSTIHFYWIKRIYRASYQIYKAKLKNEPTPLCKKTQFFSYYIIFFLSSKLFDLRPWSQNNVILTYKITSLQISLLLQKSRWYISLSNIKTLIVFLYRNFFY